MSGASDEPDEPCGSVDALLRLQECADGLGLTLRVTAEPGKADDTAVVFWRAEVLDVAAGDGATPEQAGERLRLALHALRRDRGEA